MTDADDRSASSYDATGAGHSYLEDGIGEGTSPEQIANEASETRRDETEPSRKRQKTEGVTSDDDSSDGHGQLPLATAQLLQQPQHVQRLQQLPQPSALPNLQMNSLDFQGSGLFQGYASRHLYPFLLNSGDPLQLPQQGIAAPQQMTHGQHQEATNRFNLPSVSTYPQFAGMHIDPSMGTLSDSMLAATGNVLLTQALLAAQAAGMGGMLGNLTLNSTAFGAAGMIAAAQAQAASISAVADMSANATVSGRRPVPVFMNCDEDSLSEYQCLVRQQIELFEALREDVDTSAQGRNRPIILGQVGIRCRHCAALPPANRARGAVYYPARLVGLYQAAQNLAASHLAQLCPHVPSAVRSNLEQLRDRKSSAGGGKNYWAEGAKVLGVVEDSYGLRFAR